MLWSSISRSRPQEAATRTSKSPSKADNHTTKSNVEDSESVGKCRNQAPRAPSATATASVKDQKARLGIERWGLPDIFRLLARFLRT